MAKRILIIDDDDKLNELLTEYLARFGYEVEAATHPHDGLRKLQKEQPDLIILDIMLPDMEGFEVCKEIRKSYQTPIIMLTARGEVTDRIVGLELGADDYLPKPFEPRELVARIQTVLRRGIPEVEENIKRFGTLQVDFKKHMALIDGKDTGLTSAEFQALALLVKNPNKVYNRDVLLEQLRGIEWDVFSRSVDVLISRLRQKLNDDPKNARFIKTIWGSGYKFIGDDDEI
ncbi:MAG: response regulator transcription factor [Deferribacteres bacterium]|nr:response regulator transcription factor [candidate division KSB1 bacterium]MCB9500578.1 response regulator transcription factor [Deferribacteres bacterium]